MLNVVAGVGGLQYIFNLVFHFYFDQLGLGIAGFQNWVRKVNHSRQYIVEVIQGQSWAVVEVMRSEVSVI